MSKRIVVVGGGITGLAAAFEAQAMAKAQQINVQVTILEQSDRFGGKIESHQTGDFVIEAGPDSIYTRKPAGLELIRELGLESEVVYSPAQTKTGILRNHHLYPIPPGMSIGLPTNMRTFVFNSLIPWSGKLKGLRDFYLPADKSQEDKSIGDVLRRRIGDDLVNILAEPMLAGIHAGSIDRLSIAAVAPYLRKMEQENGSLIRAMLRQGKQTQKTSATGQPKRGAFVSFRNGLQQLVDTLVSRLEPTTGLHTLSAVTRIDRETDGSFTLTVREGHEVTSQIHADGVLLCVPAFAARRLIPSPADTYDLLTDIPYVSTGAVSLVYPTSVKTANLPFTGFLVPRGEDEMLTACTVVSSKWPDAARSGTVIVRGYIGRDGEQGAMGKSDEVIVSHMKEKMRDYLGLTDEPTWWTVDRWPQAMPQYLVGHGERVEAITRQLANEIPHMYLAGAGYKGMGIPDCITQGRAAMKLCLHDLNISKVASNSSV